MLWFRVAVLSCVCALLLAPNGWASSATLDNFARGEPAAAAARWHALKDSPAPEICSDGLRMRCSFSGGADRYGWDRSVSWDLSKYNAFELELTCPDPSALRSLALYLRSGAGWFIWNKPLRGGGRQRLTLRRGDFEVEGKPTGWSAITGIRLSPWKGQPRDTELVFHQLIARQDNLYVVEGTRSATQPGDRAMARRCAQRMSDWLDRAGVPHSLITEEQLAAGAAKDASIIILPLNPDPPDDVMRSLESIVQKGAKLIVCFSASERLADLCGVKLGGYTGRQDPREFESIVFSKATKWQVPERVYQSSWGIRPALPRDRDGEVIAWWANGREERLKQPACIATPRGFWFTHILLLDDTFAKERMVLGLLGSLDRGLWFQAARKAMEDAGRIDHFAGIDAAIAAIQKQAADASASERVQAPLKEAEEQRAAMNQAFREGNYAHTVIAARQLRGALTLAFSLAQDAAPGEFRGVWDHDGTGWWPGDWDRSCHLLADSGMTAILPNLLWAGLAHYDSATVPTSETFKRYGDQAAQCVDAAHKYGLKVHAWKICWNVEQAPDAWVDKLRKQGRLLKDVNGKSINWLDPAQPANVELELASLREFVRKYPVDGIQLDYIRYPPDLPAGAVKPEVITEFVRKAHRELRPLRPNLQLSAAVWGGYPACLSSVGQDWPRWLRDGLIDFACPMNYTDDRFQFSALISKQVQLPGVRGRIYPGIGVSADESQLRADQVIDQILAARSMSMRGFVLFDLCPPLRSDILPALAQGATRPADPPRAAR